MAKYTTSLSLPSKQLIEKILDFMSGFASSSFEEQTSYHDADISVHLLVFERYSLIGSNRLSLSIQLIEDKRRLQTHVSAITAGGSQALFFKINTLGENNLLNDFAKFIERLKASD